LEQFLGYREEIGIKNRWLEKDKREREREIRDERERDER
jgi:hypothetical protein